MKSVGFKDEIELHTQNSGVNIDPNFANWIHYPLQNYTGSYVVFAVYEEFKNHIDLIEELDLDFC